MKPTLSITIDPELDARVRAEASRQRRPLSWVVSNLLLAGLRRKARKASEKVGA